MVVFTSICMNYLPKALVLGRSLKEHNPDVKYVIVLVERELPSDWPEEAWEVVDQVVLAKDLGFDDFDKFIFKHSVVEASTAVKGQAFCYLLETEDDKIVYLDPDIKVYGSLEPLNEMLDSHDIIMTPHTTVPEETDFNIHFNEMTFMKRGMYNLGFLALKNSSEGKRMAAWWRDRCAHYCYDDIPEGLFVDQKWCDLAPSYFDVLLLKDLGYNFAPWNLSHRSLSSKDGAIVVNDEYPLRFIHYSGFDSGANEEVYHLFIPDDDALEFRLRDGYIEDLEANGQEELGSHEWSYSDYADGSPIARDVRTGYRALRLYETLEEDPFSLDDAALRRLIEHASDIERGRSEGNAALRGAMRRIVPHRVRRALLVLAGKE